MNRTDHFRISHHITIHQEGNQRILTCQPTENPVYGYFLLNRFGY